MLRSYCVLFSLAVSPCSLYLLYLYSICSPRCISQPVISVPRPLRERLAVRHLKPPTFLNTFYTFFFKPISLFQRVKQDILSCLVWVILPVFEVIVREVLIFQVQRWRFIGSAVTLR